MGYAPGQFNLDTPKISKKYGFLKKYLLFKYGALFKSIYVKLLEGNPWGMQLKSHPSAQIAPGLGNIASRLLNHSQHQLCFKFHQ